MENVTRSRGITSRGKSVFASVHLYGSTAHISLQFTLSGGTFLVTDVKVQCKAGGKKGKLFGRTVLSNEM